MKGAAHITILLALLVGLGACAPRKSRKVPSDFALRITHAGCRGYCPSFSIEVDANAKATFQGLRAVEMIGTYHKILPPKTMRALVNTLDEVRFIDFGELYTSGLADLPAIVTEATWRGQQKRVEDSGGAPQALKEMEARLETLIGRDGWVKAEE